MKRIILLSAFLMGLCIVSFGQVNKPTKPMQKPEEQIKRYWFVMLTKGSKREQDSATAKKIQEGHIANINRLYNAGKL